jgi:hypothetical protein
MFTIPSTHQLHASRERLSYFGFMTRSHGRLGFSGSVRNMEAHRELLRWGKENGVEWDGIEPRPIPGRGVGIVATKQLGVRTCWPARH